MNTQSPPPKHTPGPWITATGFVPILKKDALGVLKESHKPGEQGESICVVATVAAMGPHDQGNALLIAAAPDLLDVVKRFATSGCLAGVEPDKDSDDPIADLLARAHAALGKALGLSGQNVIGQARRGQAQI
jgi:hypothetical protein